LFIVLLTDNITFDKTIPYTYLLGVEAEELIIDLIGNIFGEPKMINEIRGQISVDCPVCSYTIKGLDKLDGKGNLEINYQQHVYKCWACAETHGTHGHLGKLIDKHGSKKDKKIYNLIRPDEFEKKEKVYKKLELPKEYKKFDEVHPLHIPRKEALNYLKKRGITEEIIEKYQIGMCLEGEYSGRIIVPSFDKKGELNFFVSRSWNPRSKLKYKNPEASKDFLIFNESLIDWKKDIYLVEGVFDSFFLDNSICLLGKFLTDNLWEKLYSKAKKNIIVCLDGDAYADAKNLYDKLNGGALYNRVKLVKLPKDKDVCDLKGDIEKYYVEFK
jgi:DNA primase